MSSKRTLKEQGFVSIIVAATIMILLSLITIGFTRLMQREQREALDRQLTRQATYAAESGINTIWEYILDESVQEQKTECSHDQNPFHIDDTTFITSNGVEAVPYFDEADDTASIQITCALYDKNPQSLTYTLGKNEDVVTPFEDKDGTPIDSITVSWNSQVGNTAVHGSCGDGDDFEFPASMDDNIPVLRLDLYNTSNLDRTSIANNSYFMYLIPCDSVSGTNGVDLEQDQRSIYKLPVNCDGGECTFSFNLSDFVTDRTSFFVRQKLLYGAGRVTYTAIDENREPVEFKDSQSVIDVTARASDVVRRLLVHVPYGATDPVPAGVATVEEGYTGANNSGFCKDITVIDDGPASGYKIENNCLD